MLAVADFRVDGADAFSDEVMEAETVAGWAKLL